MRLVTFSYPSAFFSSKPSFGLGHAHSRPKRPHERLQKNTVLHQTYLFRGSDKGHEILPQLLMKRFPDGASILALGSSTGEADVITPALCFHALNPNYPVNITGIDIDPDLINIAQQKLFTVPEMLLIWLKLKDQQLPLLPFKQIIKFLSPQKQEQLEQNPLIKELQLHNSEYPELQAIQKTIDWFRKPLHTLGYIIPHLKSLSKEVLSPKTLLTLKPAIAKTVHYETGDMIDIAKDVQRISQQHAILLGNSLCYLPAKDQIELIKNLARHMQPNALVSVDPFDAEYKLTNTLFTAAGFKKLSPPQAASRIFYEKPTDALPIDDNPAGLAELSRLQALMERAEQQLKKL